jgi:hypothetical protein
MMMMKNDPNEILQKNPQLDRGRIAELKAFQARMENAGANFRTRYRVEPALGSLMAFAQQRRG